MRSTFRLMFYINRNKVKSDGTTAILCRISIDGRKSAVTTGIYCKPSDWDSNKGEYHLLNLTAILRQNELSSLGIIV